MVPAASTRASRAGTFAAWPTMRTVASPSGLPETVLDARATATRSPRSTAALAQPLEQRRDAVADVVARWPRFLDVWARLGELARDDVEALRVLPRRLPPRPRPAAPVGLARLAATCAGSTRPTAASSARSTACARAAAAIGEADEAQRCDEFLHQLDPDWDWRRSRPLRRQRFDPRTS